MRLLAELLDGEKINETTKLALLSELIAAQALALAAFHHAPIRSVREAQQLVFEASSYPGVLMKKVGNDGENVGQRATERLCALVGFHPADCP